MRIMQKAAKLYKKSNIEGKSDNDRLIQTFQIGIKAIQQNKIDKAQKVLLVLKNALDFSKSPELAIGLHRLYSYTEDCIKKQRKDVAIQVLTRLEYSFANAIKSNKSQELSTKSSKIQ